MLNHKEEEKENSKKLIKFSKNYEKKINEVKNKKIRNSLSRFLDSIKNG